MKRSNTGCDSKDQDAKFARGVDVDKSFLTSLYEHASAASAYVLALLAAAWHIISSWHKTQARLDGIEKDVKDIMKSIDEMKKEIIDLIYRMNQH